MPDCLLCQSDQISLITVIPKEEIETLWKSSFAINITRELGGGQQISLYGCMRCSIGFFHPAIVGSSWMYEQLQQFEWYYLNRKWEHDIALRDVKRGAKVLEIGCGRGDFLTRLLTEVQADCFGIELNDKAIKEAKKLGLNVSRQNVTDLLPQQAGSYDVVCSFQVLEHVATPQDFIRASVELLKPGGHLLLSVPNNDGFLRLVRQDPLNQPPHHISHWRAKVFEWLPNRFPLTLEKLLFEPLASYHLSQYLDTQFHRLPYIPIVSGIGYRAAKYVIAPIARTTKLSNFAKGHSLYACYRKSV